MAYSVFLRNSFFVYSDRRGVAGARRRLVIQPSAFRDGPTFCSIAVSDGAYENRPIRAARPRINATEL